MAKFDQWTLGWPVRQIVSKEECQSGRCPPPPPTPVIGWHLIFASLSNMQERKHVLKVDCQVKLDHGRQLDVHADPGLVGVSQFRRPKIKYVCVSIGCQASRCADVSAERMIGSEVGGWVTALGGSSRSSYCNTHAHTVLIDSCEIEKEPTLTSRNEILYIIQPVHGAFRGRKKKIKLSICGTFPLNLRSLSACSITSSSFSPQCSSRCFDVIVFQTSFATTGAAGSQIYSRAKNLLLQKINKEIVKFSYPNFK